MHDNPEPIYEGQAMGEQQITRTDDTSDATLYVVAYVEVMPASTAEAAALLRQYREASRVEAGCRHLEVLQQCGRPDHFAIVETWQDEKSFDAHVSAAHTRAFQERLQARQASPYDARLHQGLAIGATPTSHVPGTTYVLTHADAIPPAKDDATALLKQLAETSRRDDGGVRFEVLQQRSRLNHFTILEIWQDQKALEAHVMAGHTRQFREQFQPMSGSLYDERLYQALD
jgi:quinol monooxygenase YgiN